MVKCDSCDVNTYVNGSTIDLGLLVYVILNLHFDVYRIRVQVDYVYDEIMKCSFFIYWI